MELLDDARSWPSINTCLLRQNGARFVGYLRALRKAGIPVDPLNVLSSDGHSADRAFSAVPSRFSNDRPTASFSTDSVMTFATFRALKTLGISIPDEVSLMGSTTSNGPGS